MVGVRVVFAEVNIDGLRGEISNLLNVKNLLTRPQRADNVVPTKW